MRIIAAHAWKLAELRTGSLSWQRASKSWAMITRIVQRLGIG